MKVLAIVCNYKWTHTDYLRALAQRVELMVAWSGEVHDGAIQNAIKAGVNASPLGKLDTEGESAITRRLADLFDEWKPSLVHLLYYYNEHLTAIAREILPAHVPVIFECRDPLTTLNYGNPNPKISELEKTALEVSDGQIFVSKIMREYYELSYDMDLKDTSIIIPHAFAARSAAPPSPKLSARDGRIHLAMVGSVQPNPDDGRYYVNMIRRLVRTGFVVHSHFFEARFPHDEYRQLAEELDDYHYHATVGFNHATKLSEIISTYDLMGVFHQLDATGRNESPTLAICMPTKAVCGWHHGAIPVVCFRHYGGLVERIEDMDIGFVIDKLEDTKNIVTDRDAIQRKTQACLRHRYRFTHEYSVRLIAAFYKRLIAARNTGGPTTR